MVMCFTLRRKKKHTEKYQGYVGRHILDKLRAWSHLRHAAQIKLERLLTFVKNIVKQEVTITSVIHII